MSKFDSKLTVDEFLKGYKLDKTGNLKVINEVSADNARELFKKTVFEASSAWFTEDDGTDGAEVWGNEAPAENADQPPESMDEKKSEDDFDFSFMDHGIKEDDMSTAYPSGLNGQDVGNDLGIDDSHVTGEDDIGKMYSGSRPLTAYNIGSVG